MSETFAKLTKNLTKNASQNFERCKQKDRKEDSRKDHPRQNLRSQEQKQIQNCAKVPFFFFNFLCFLYFYNFSTDFAKESPPK